MSKLVLAAAVLMWIPFQPATASSCDTGHWVRSVQGDGQIVILEDGTIWEVSSLDRIDTALWLPLTDVIICDDKLINTDDDETVDVVRLR